MKIIKKFWGVALVLVLLSTMFLSAAPVSAANYNFSNDLTIPSAANGILGFAGMSFTDVAQSGSVIFGTTTNTVGGPVPPNFLYTSPNGGAVWYPVAATGLPNVLATDTWVLVAVAPDNPNIVAVVNRIAATPDRVWISTNGGTTFRALPVLAVGTVIASMDISGLAGSRYLAIGGTDAVGPFVWSWEIDIATTWVNPDDPTALGDTYATEITPNTDVLAVIYSESFSVDQALLVITLDGAAAGNITLNAYSYMFQDWNADLGGFAFPRPMVTVVGAVTLTSARATMALDANFSLGDNELGFIGIEITDSALGEVGGVFRINTGMAPLTKIYTAVNGINSVAWDGTNLMAADYDIVTGGVLTIFRSANALASSGWVFLPSAQLKTPGTGTLPLVIFNGGVGYAFSQGDNSAVAKTTDLGKSFDGVALCNTTFANFVDFWVNADGTRKYALTDDAVAGDIDVWSLNAGVWKRAAILQGQSTLLWMVRAAQSNPDAVYLGQQTAKNMYKSLDGGNFVWTKRSCTQNIQDFAVQSATTVYVSVNLAGTVVKSTTGAAGWNLPVSTLISLYGDTNYSLNLVADDQLLVGGNAGYVSYSNNGNTSWNVIGSVIAAAGTTLATSTTTDGVISTGDSIFAASSTGLTSDICKWVIGTNTTVGGWSYDVIDKGVTATATAYLTDADITGLVYANGILYAWDNSAISLSGKMLYRFINPTWFVTFADDIIALPGAAAAGFDQFLNVINALQYSTGSTTLWALDQASVPSMTLKYYTEYLVSAAAVGPVPTYPINDTVITINSIAGNVNDFVFKWNCPPAISTAQFYTFDIRVFLDEAGTILVGGDAGIGLAMGGLTSSIAASALTAPAFNPVPGTTYFWDVRTATPVTGYWSAMQTFSIQQLAAIVPVQTSPVNGTIIEASAAAFSWLPISGATSYTFQLDTGATFTAPLYSATVATAGASLPITIKLEAGRTYFWRVKVLTPTEGEWSSVANFTVAAESTTSTITTVTPTTTTVTNTTITIPPATSTVITVPPATQTVEEVNPTYIWAIIIIGAVLVLAVIVLIVRTRRSV